MKNRQSNFMFVLLVGALLVLSYLPAFAQSGGGGQGAISEFDSVYKIPSTAEGTIRVYGPVGNATLLDVQCGTSCSFDGFGVNAGSAQTIYVRAHGRPCKKTVISSGRDIFIPIKYLSEWDSFIMAGPATNPSFQVTPCNIAPYCDGNMIINPDGVDTTCPGGQTCFDPGTGPVCVVACPANCSALTEITPPANSTPVTSSCAAPDGGTCNCTMVTDFTCNAGFYRSGNICTPSCSNLCSDLTVVAVPPNATGTQMTCSQTTTAPCNNMAVTVSWTCNSGYHTNVAGTGCDLNVTPYACTGTAPSNATLISGDDAGLTANTARTLVASNTAAKCEYACNTTPAPGYTFAGGTCHVNCTTGATNGSGVNQCTVTSAMTHGQSGVAQTCAQGGTCTASCTDGTVAFTNNCVASTYICTGTAPSNATLITGDASSLTANTAITLVAANTSAKCEYMCNTTPAPGYTLASGSCHANCTTGATNGSGATQCTVTSSMTHGQSGVAQTCAQGGTCTASCTDGAVAFTNNCVASSYTCTGTAPSNATLVTGDGTGLTANTARTLVASNTAAKCEYMCNTTPAPGYTFASGTCHVNCTLPWGGTLAHGSSVTAYQTATACNISGESCVSQVRTCTDGSLSGSYTNQSCSLNMSPCFHCGNYSQPAMCLGSWQETECQATDPYTGQCMYSTTVTKYCSGSTESDCIYSNGGNLDSPCLWVPSQTIACDQRNCVDDFRGMAQDLADEYHGVQYWNSGSKTWGVCKTRNGSHCNADQQCQVGSCGSYDFPYTVTSFNSCRNDLGYSSINYNGFTVWVSSSNGPYNGTVSCQSIYFHCLPTGNIWYRSTQTDSRTYSQ